MDPLAFQHCYTGSFDKCVEYTKRGYYTSILGYILKPGSDEVKKCLRDGVVPIDRPVIKTDAGYMGFNGNKYSFFDGEGGKPLLV